MKPPPLDPSRLDLGLQRLVAAISDQPDYAERLARMALTFRKQPDRGDALRLAREARRLCPDDPIIRTLTEWTLRREAPLWHFALVQDARRNQVYADALDHHVRPGMTVLEIGTGSGLLAMLAARAGAEHVYTCEVEPTVAAAARRVIAANGLADRITVIDGNAASLRVGGTLPRRADLFVAEIVDNSLLGEGVLPLTEYARRELLTEDAVLLPQRIGAVGMLVDSSLQRANAYMGEAMGFDLRAFNEFAPSHLATPPGGGEFTALSAPACLFDFDLQGDNPKPAQPLDYQFKVTADGVADGVLRWLRLDFGGNILFENRPPQTSAWLPLLHTFAIPSKVAIGDTLPLRLYHDRERIFISSA